MSIYSVSLKYMQVDNTCNSCKTEFAMELCTQISKGAGIKNFYFAMQWAEMEDRLHVLSHSPDATQYDLL